MDRDRMDVVQFLWIAYVMPFCMEGGVRKLILINFFSPSKLVRKRDKALAKDETPSIQHIDTEMSRASARAAVGEIGASRI